MPGRAVVESPPSSQSSLSDSPFDTSRTAGASRNSTRGKRVVRDSEDPTGEEDEVDSVMSGLEENKNDGREDKEESDELEDEEDDDEEEEEDDELDEGDGRAAGRPKRRAAAAASSSSASRQSKRTRNVPERRAAATSSKRTSRSQRVVEEDEEDEEDDGEEEDDEMESESEESEARTTPNSRSKRITLRLSRQKQADTKRKPAQVTKKAPAARATAPRQSASRVIAHEDDDEEEEDDELEDDDEEATGAGMEGIGESDESEDFENENSFAHLPKTARQLAKERAAQGIETPESEMMETPEEGGALKKQQMTESELALKRSEMARRRRNQTEKKLEDDKIETINRLLKKQVSRRSTRGTRSGGGKGGEADDSDGENNEEGEASPNDAAKQARSGNQPTALQRKQQPQPFFRYIQSIHGPSTLSMPVEEQEERQPYKQKWDQMFTLTSK